MINQSILKSESTNAQQAFNLQITKSICPVCWKVIPAWWEKEAGNIYLVKTCPEHGNFRTIIWRGIPPIETWRYPKIPSRPRAAFTSIQKGCPFDCGLCPDHRQHTCTALLEVTERCNLNCAFCFAGSGSMARADPSLEVICGWYDRLLEAGGPYNVQISGGEPTMRDDLPQIMEAGRERGFQFLQLNTNGIRIGKDKDYAPRLKEAGLSSLFLQFDGTDERVYRTLRGRELLDVKLKAIEHCAGNELGVVLVPTLVPGVNIDQIGNILRLAQQYIPVVRGVHFQPVSYFGRYPGQVVHDSERFTLPEVIQQIELQSEGLIKSSSFKPPACENALCSFHGNFVLKKDGTLEAVSRRQSTDCCQPILAEEGASKSRSFVAQHWSAPKSKKNCVFEKDNVYDFGEWDAFIDRLHTHSFTISGMAFQDAWNLDLNRLQDCCIHIVSPEGNLIPFCAYNLTNQRGQALYRAKIKP